MARKIDRQEKISKNPREKLNSRKEARGSVGQGRRGRKKGSSFSQGRKRKGSKKKETVRLLRSNFTLLGSLAMGGKTSAQDTTTVFHPWRLGS
jgi:hypothetical protein